MKEIVSKTVINHFNDFTFHIAHASFLTTVLNLSLRIIILTTRTNRSNINMTKWRNKEMSVAIFLSDLNLVTSIYSLGLFM